MEVVTMQRVYICKIGINRHTQYIDSLSKIILEMNLLLRDTPFFEALQTQVTFIFGGPLSSRISSFVRTAVATSALESFAAYTFFVVLLL